MKKTERQALIETLKARFAANAPRHEGIQWADVAGRLEQEAGALATLLRMEESGGEPDVIGRDEKSGQFVFCDCSTESPAGRRSLCYDRKALAARKQNKPRDSVEAVAEAIGVELLTEDQYRALQQLGEFDTRTSSWIRTPPEIRSLGGALFCDRRYDTVFVYHNGADSYYAARGFRGLLRV